MGGALVRPVICTLQKLALLGTTTPRQPTTAPSSKENTWLWPQRETTKWRSTESEEHATGLSYGSKRALAWSRGALRE
jgi:hypothetical protein